MRNKELVLLHLDKLLGSNVVLKDEEDFKNKLSNMVEDGVDNLQFVSDFDDTITKHIVDGKRGLTSFDVFIRAKSISQVCIDRVKAHLSMLEPNLFNANLEPDQQVQFDRELAKLLACSVGERIGLAEIHEAVERVVTPLKDGCKELLTLLSDLRVPLTVVSAGSGEVIEKMLKDFNAKVVANYVKFQDDHITELLKPNIGMFNKHKVPLPIDPSRSNIIVIGDFAWDSKIADNVVNVKNTLKIGFFYGRKNESIEQDLNFFDVLLLDDESMNVALGILKLVAKIDE
uniref:5'-nucleotidase n=1 Tax=Graphocephala atropunctata TaxID=36148 RepID=A0A1B6LV25_9HEMI